MLTKPSSTLKQWRPLVSIICRCLNEKESVGIFLQMLSLQYYTNWELLVVDSGSTDGSIEVIKKGHPRVLKLISKEEYNPGAVLNSMVQLARGEIVVFNNADCIPKNREWLGNLVFPLKYQWNGATFARQIGTPSLRLQVLRDLDRAYGFGIHNAKWFHFFSLASCATKKQLLLENLFNPSFMYCEDIEWSYRIKNKNFNLIYVPLSQVEHRHNYGLKSIAKRSYNEGKALAMIFPNRYKVCSFWRHLVLSYLAELYYDLAFFMAHGYWFKIFWAFPYSIFYRAWQKVSFYRGVVFTRKNFFRKDLFSKKRYVS